MVFAAVVDVEVRVDGSRGTVVMEVVVWVVVGGAWE